MFKVLAIMGSPREMGNSKIIVEQILKGIRSETGDVEITRISLRNVQIHPCIACDGCHHKAGCIIKDDMQKLYPAFDQADLVIVASPIYFNSVSAQLKSLIDRCQAIWASKYILKKPMIDRDKYRLGVFIATAGTPEDIAEFEPSKRVMDLFFKAINTTYSHNFLISNTDSSPVNSRDEVLKDAHQLGIELSRLLCHQLDVDRGIINTKEVGTMSKVKWVELTIADPITADIYKGLLESSSIPVFLRSDTTNTVYPFTMGALGNVDVLVPENQLELAKQLIEEVEIGEWEIEDEDWDENFEE